MLDAGNRERGVLQNILIVIRNVCSFLTSQSVWGYNTTVRRFAHVLTGGDDAGGEGAATVDIMVPDAGL